jgi:hypothetical protein
VSGTLEMSVVLYSAFHSYLGSTVIPLCFWLLIGYASYECLAKTKAHKEREQARLDTLTRDVGILKEALNDEAIYDYIDDNVGEAREAIEQLQAVKTVTQEDLKPIKDDIYRANMMHYTNIEKLEKSHLSLQDSYLSLKGDYLMLRDEVAAIKAWAKQGRLQDGLYDAGWRLSTRPTW